MRVKISQLVVLIAFALVVFALTLVVLSLVSSPVKEPVAFVENRTVITKSDLFYEYQITKYPTKVEIVESEDDLSKMIGISTEPWIFDFGVIPQTQASVKKILTLNDIKEGKLNVELTVFGNISDMVSFSKNDFYLEGDEEVFVFLNVTEETKLGNYNGEIDIIVKKESFG